MQGEHERCEVCTRRGESKFRHLEVGMHSTSEGLGAVWLERSRGKSVPHSRREAERLLWSSGSCQGDLGRGLEGEVTSSHIKGLCKGSREVEAESERRVGQRRGLALHEGAGVATDGISQCSISVVFLLFKTSLAASCL